MVDFALEADLISQGNQHVAGIDEVGRGPLAGPVVAAAVILDPHNIPDGLNDSKRLTEKKRQSLFHDITATAHIGLASLPAEHIDQLNILHASLKAMVMAVKALPQTPNHCLIDGNQVPSELDLPACAIVKGDNKSVSIAAASIIAKIIRDDMMIQLSRIYPNYGFEKNKGYATKAHLEALNRFGAINQHRQSFAPVKDQAQG